jgi:hypothetical protein
MHLSLKCVLFALPILRDLLDHCNILWSVCLMKIIVALNTDPWLLYPRATSFLCLSAVKYGRPSVYEHFIYDDSILRTIIIYTHSFNNGQVFTLTKKMVLSPKYAQRRKRSFWRYFLLKICFSVTVFTVCHSLLNKNDDTNNYEICRQ